MISVCLAVKNGEAFLEEQVNSILPQLSEKDEIVVSDDHSEDRTIEILTSLDDPRIRIVHSIKPGVVANFENGLSHCRGENIFLADQDDIWAPAKITTMSRHLVNFDLVVCDCAVVDEQKRLRNSSFFELNKSGKGFIKNLIRNSYMGCCMGFHRKMLNKVLPFPQNIPIHDMWIGLVAEWHYKVLFLEEPLVLHRRHNANYSSTTGESRLPFSSKFSNRYRFLKNLLRLNYV